MSILKLFFILSIFLSMSCTVRTSDEEKLSLFIEKHVAKLEPLRKQEALAYWDAATTGARESYDRYSRLQIEIKKLYSSKDDFALLSSLREANKVKDPLLRRQLEFLYLSHLENQIDTTLMKDMVEGATAVEERFNTYRAEIDGKQVTNNDILVVLKESTDSEARRRAWEASKQIGQIVADQVIALAKKRNEAARTLGFSDFFQMQLALNEQNEADLMAIFDELDSLTRDSFFSIKASIDSSLAARCGIAPEAMMPWHYHDPFFQEAPSYLEIDLDSYFKGMDVIAIATRFFDGMGLEVSDILGRSDLFEREGKDQHAFCTDIDREGDVRILVNIKDNANWMETTLHELGHATYDKYIDRSLPFLVRTSAHTLATEGVAMLMGRQVKDPAWLGAMTGISAEEKEQVRDNLRELQTAFELIFSRWCQVMFRFERELYRNPDQDLNTLWWELVGNYQGLRKPEERNAPDWAAKIHIAAYPVYYHNYMLGELFASQLAAAIPKEALRGSAGTEITFAGHPAVGSYLIEKVFRPGASFHWQDFVQRATAEPLSAKHFALQFVGI
jgi:peptidyl-dipeptidase A